MTHIRHLLPAAGLLLPLFAIPCTASTYSISEIPGQALAITDSGYVLQGTMMQNPDGTVSSPSESIAGSAVNNKGEVVGTLLGSSLPAVWDGTSVYSLPTLPIGSELGGQATGVNDTGVIVGWITAGTDATDGAFAPPQRLEAVRWTNGIAEDIGASLPNGNFAKAINNRGTVIIDSNPQAALASLPTSQSYILHGNTLTPITANDGSSLGVSAWAINDNDEVAGTIYLADGSAHAFTWTGGHMTIAPSISPLSPALDGAMSINANGEVVGDSRSATSNGLFPFVWDGQNQPIDLNTLIPPDSGWQLISALGINSAGAIVGNGLLNDVPTGFLLTPTSATPSIPTPEPSELSLMALSAVIFVGRRHRARKNGARNYN